jgi:hypothetical protein
MKTAKVLSEDDLTLEKLKKFFERLYVKTELTERDHLIVHVDNWSSVFITLDKHRKLLKILTESITAISSADSLFQSRGIPSLLIIACHTTAGSVPTNYSQYCAS